MMPVATAAPDERPPIHREVRRPAPKRNTAPPPAHRAIRRVWYEVSGFVLIFLAAATLFLLIFAFAHSNERIVGTAIAANLRLFVGASAWALPPLLLICGHRFARGRHRAWRNVFGAVLLFLIFSTGRHLSGQFAHGFEFLPDNLRGYGGYLGAGLSWGLRAFAGTAGGYVVLGALTMIALPSLVGVPLSSGRAVVARFFTGGKQCASAVQAGTSGQTWPPAARPTPQAEMASGKSLALAPALAPEARAEMLDGTEWCAVCGRAKGYGESFCPSCGATHGKPRIEPQTVSEAVKRSKPSKRKFARRMG